MRLQHCSPTQFQVVYEHVRPDGTVTWAAKGHSCSYDFEGRAWKSTMIVPGDWVRIYPGDGCVLARGPGCRPQGMVIAIKGNDFLILWSGDEKAERLGV